MTTPAQPTGAQPTQLVAGTRATRAALAVGTILSVVCFGIALGLEFLGRPAGSGSATDLGAVARSAAAFETWGWATLGTFAVIASPVAAIAATAAEYFVARDRRTGWTAVAVLVVLAMSLAVSLLAR